ncbi:hypothetical protein HWV62_16062 [Athelia sp. TMB]|nr:hypothetical protein HWV62_43672 [Athelia sp. TMB]KAF7971869.1 hypothetical protein HWV62_19745 [Athelia sp. TMB]KAF7984241.1 hypothetical protein HWV62_16062 [Athelia sp. TMB]
MPTKATVLAAAGVVTAAPVIFYLLRFRFAPIHFSYSVPKAFLESRAMAITNPRHHMTATDSFTLRLSPSQLRHVGARTDEELLARMTKGFFGGWIFLPEGSLFRWLLSGRPEDRLVGFSALEPNIVPQGHSYQARNTFLGMSNRYPSGIGPNRVWFPKDIPAKSLLPYKSILYGGFQVIDQHCPSIPPHVSDDEPLAEQIGSYVDIAFSSDEASFAGCHRLEVLRPRRPTLDGAKELRVTETEGDIHADSEEALGVVLRLSHFRQNPIKNQPSPVEGLKWLHFVYARLLFEDSVRHVLGR